MHAVSLNSNTGNNRYYSFNRDLTHFIVFTAEAYVYAVDAGFLANQLAFAKADLAAVDRSVTPWVVALVHKDWTMQPNAFKDFSPVLESGGVDVLFCGHVHCEGKIARAGRQLTRWLAPRARAAPPRPPPPLLPLPPSPLPRLQPLHVKTSPATLLMLYHETPPSPLRARRARHRPYDPMTGDIDTGAVSSDGKTYSNPKYMTTIVSGK